VRLLAECPTSPAVPLWGLVDASVTGGGPIPPDALGPLVVRAVRDDASAARVRPWLRALLLAPGASAAAAAAVECVAAAADADPGVAAQVARHAPALFGDVLVSPARADWDACVRVCDAIAAAVQCGTALAAWDAFFADEVLPEAPAGETKVDGTHGAFIGCWARLVSAARAYTSERLALVVRGIVHFAGLRCRDDVNVRELLEFVGQFEWETVRPFVREIARAVIDREVCPGAERFAEWVRAHADEPECAEVIANGQRETVGQVQVQVKVQVEVEGGQAAVGAEEQSPIPEAVLA
jgi:hypothetical protein